MDRKHIKFSVDAQEYQKLLKEENEELKEKIICLESDACNEVSQAQFDDAMEDKDIEIKKLKEIIIGLGPQGSYLISAEAEVKKLQEENEELKKNEGWWRHEIVKLLGWDEKEGAKWNSPYEHDVKVRDIFETLEGYIFAVRGGNQHDCETGEVNGYSPSLKQIKKENEKLNIKLKNSAKITKFVQKKVEKLKEENEELKKERDHFKKMCLKWQESADFNLPQSDSDEESESDDE
tara:strand:+ start:546 stop:1250 length:705 start_codon:yes stop_codon:yes gene_type:complete